MPGRMVAGALTMAIIRAAWRAVWGGLARRLGLAPDPRAKTQAEIEAARRASGQGDVAAVNRRIQRWRRDKAGANPVTRL